MSLENIKTGDTVAILVWLSGQAKHHPNRTSTVTKATAKRIDVCGYIYDRTGKGLRKHNYDRISADASIIADLKTKEDKRAAERAESERLNAEKHNRLTYKLATQIVGPWKIDSITDLELLGEEYLQRIVTDIAKALAEKQ